MIRDNLILDLSGELIVDNFAGGGSIQPILTDILT